MNQPDQKFFYMNLKRKTSAKGTNFYTGKYAYAIDIVGFEKKDGSGDITLWLSPKDMDQVAKQTENRGYGASNQAAQNTQAPRRAPPTIPKPRPVQQQRQEDPPEYLSEAPLDDDMGF